MGDCVIFCAAEFTKLQKEIEREDFIIAADGGYLHTQRLGLTPQGVIGDFDSLGYVPEGSRVFPVEKDDTDAMLAIRQGLELGYHRFLLYGAVDGPRLDHTVANIQALEYLCRHGACGYLLGNRSNLTVLKNGSLRFPAGCSGDFSVFALGGSAEGVSLKGLYYSLEDGELDCGFPLGVSNHFTGETAEISVKNGSLLLIWAAENGLPEERSEC